MLNTMTVGELIEALQRCDPHKPVVLFRDSPVDTVREKFIQGLGSTGHCVVSLYCKAPPEQAIIIDPSPFKGKHPILDWTKP